MDAILGGWRLSGIFQARSGFPITVIDGRAPSLQGTRGNERPNCVGDPVPADQNINHWLDINAFARAPLRHVRQLSDRRRRARRATRTSTPCWRSGSTSAAARYFEFRAEAFNLTNTPSFGPPARDINAPNTFGTITSTVSTARTVELVLKFFF